MLSPFEKWGVRGDLSNKISPNRSFLKRGGLNNYKHVGWVEAIAETHHNGFLKRWVSRCSTHPTLGYQFKPTNSYVGLAIALSWGKPRGVWIFIKTEAIN